ncbi:MAG: transposase [Bryobacteraceae bacterium]
MDGREQRGLEIAGQVKLSRDGSGWVVPSQGGKGINYTVDMKGDTPTCSCPDHATRRVKCKHIFAVEFSIQRETRLDGTTTVTKTVRVTYAQDWPAYNAAQSHEKTRVTELLRGLCDGISQPPQGRGRPRLPLADVVFSAVMKVYSTVSGRRATSDLRECEAKGHIAHAPHYNSVFHYLEDPTLTPILKALIEESASPLKALESDFAVDGSGFSTCTYERWYDEKYGKMRSDHQWLKVHLMIGVKTNIVTSVEVTDPSKHDSPYLPVLLEATTKRFQVAEVSADKGYSSKKNVEAVVKAGATPYIPFISNRTGQGPELWRKLWHFYEFNRSEFLASYHKRSNIESTFSMIKAKFGSSVRSKTPVAQMNEVLCKVLCHNLCVLVQSIYELGIGPTFWSAST